MNKHTSSKDLISTCVLAFIEYYSILVLTFMCEHFTQNVRIAFINMFNWEHKKKEIEVWKINGKISYVHCVFKNVTKFSDFCEKFVEVVFKIQWKEWNDYFLGMPFAWFYSCCKVCYAEECYHWDNITDNISSPSVWFMYFTFAQNTL